MGGGGVPCPRSGWEYPIPGLDWGGVPHPRSELGGGTLSQVWMRVPHPGSGQEVPHPKSRGGGIPSQVWTQGGTPSKIRMGVPPSVETGWGCTPHPGLDGDTPSVETGWGYPPTPSKSGWGTPPPRQETDQHREHLLRGGRYASCVHAGGLSCQIYCNRYFSRDRDYNERVVWCYDIFTLHMNKDWNQEKWAA